MQLKYSFPSFSFSSAKSWTRSLRAQSRRTSETSSWSKSKVQVSCRVSGFRVLAAGHALLQLQAQSGRRAS